MGMFLVYLRIRYGSRYHPKLESDEPKPSDAASTSPSCADAVRGGDQDPQGANLLVQRDSKCETPDGGRARSGVLNQQVAQMFGGKSIYVESDDDAARAAADSDEDSARAIDAPTWNRTRTRLVQRRTRTTTPRARSTPPPTSGGGAAASRRRRAMPSPR